MLFIETTLFTKLLGNYLSDDDYRELQLFLLENPDIGNIIQGTGGLRKLRWAAKNKGKRGGVRVIYYWLTSEDKIYMMTLYAKNEMADLSMQDKKLLKKMIEENRL